MRRYLHGEIRETVHPLARRRQGRTASRDRQPISAAATGVSCPLAARGDLTLAGSSLTRSITLGRSRADEIARRALRIRDPPAGTTAQTAYGSFQRSMAISASRCILTYVVFPFAMPAAGFAAGVGPVIGIVVGVVALCCDVLTIRRFFSIDHPWRWHVAVVVACVMVLLVFLLLQDAAHLVI